MNAALPPRAVSSLQLPWQHRFADLGEAFFVDQAPTPLPAPYWVCHSPELGDALGLPGDWHAADEWLQALSGNALAAGSRPLASVYSGHQFGVWAGQLGDGRAILLGELAGMEIQLKGAGLTPFSRMGDGRAVLRSSIREFLCSEAMQGLGIPTTRALALTGSPAPVRRETMETAAVVTRVAPSFIRFGHFEHFCHHDQPEALRQLADYVIDRYAPHCRDAAKGPNPYVALLAHVTELTAQLLAQWQAVGFCHGVMNTDNMSILGLTLDYGPFQFLDIYDPAHICNHSDTQGRYAFHKQPSIAYWNLFCLGQALLPLIEEQEAAIAALETFKVHYPAAFEARMFAKLGFVQSLPEPLRGEARRLLEDALQLLADNRVDYSIFWRRLSHWADQGTLPATEAVRDLFLHRDAADAWLQRFAALIQSAGSAHSAATMLAGNPHYVLRNHLCELAIRSAQAGDFSKVEELRQVLQNPFVEHPGQEHLAGFAPDWAADLSVSCSS